MLFNMTQTFNHNLSLFVLSVSFLSLFRPEKFRGHARAPLGENDFFFGTWKKPCFTSFSLGKWFNFVAVSRDACSGIVHAHTIPGKFLFLLAMKTQNVMGTFGPVVCHN